MKKWFVGLLPALLLALFVSSCKKANGAAGKVPESADVLVYLDGKNITQEPLFIEHEKQISELLSEASLDKGLLDSRIWIFGSLKEEWGGFLLQSTNGQVGKFFDFCLKKIKEDDDSVKESTEKKERRVTGKISDDLSFLSVLYDENLMLFAVNKTDPAFFQAKKANALFKELSTDNVLLSTSIKVDLPQNGKFLTKDAIDSAFQMAPFLKKLETVSLSLPPSKDKKALGKLHAVFKDEESASAASGMVAMGLSFAAKEMPDVTKMVTCKNQKNALDISFDLAFLMTQVNSALAKARGKAQAISCTGNLKQVGLGIVMYASDHDKLPAANGWQKAILEYVGNAKAMECPENHSHYRYFGNGQAETSLENPSSMIMAICECVHQGRLNVLFADGHVSSVDSNKVKQAIQKAKPGQLPVLP